MKGSYRGIRTSILIAQADDEDFRCRREYLSCNIVFPSLYVEYIDASLVPWIAAAIDCEGYGIVLHDVYVYSIIQKFNEMYRTVKIPGTPAPPCAWTRPGAALCRPLHLRSDWEVSVIAYPLSERQKKKKKKKTRCE